MSAPWPWHRRAAKRGLDVTVSLLALLVLAIPLLLMGALVRLTSKGPALFRQERVGRGGRRFRIWKFRTMVHDAEVKGPLVTASGDPRVTPLGRLLRKTKLDELPQLVNVLVGDMSLVGPRPEVPRYVATYDTDQLQVLSVRPGLTDPASILYRNEEQLLAGAEDREAAYVLDVMPRKLALARDYVARQTFWLDLRLIARTVDVLLRGRSRIE